MEGGCGRRWWRAGMKDMCESEFTLIAEGMVPRLHAYSPLIIHEEKPRLGDLKNFSALSNLPTISDILAASSCRANVRPARYQSSLRFLCVDCAFCKCEREQERWGLLCACVRCLFYRLLSN